MVERRSGAKASARAALDSGRRSEVGTGRSEVGRSEVGTELLFPALRDTAAAQERTSAVGEVSIPRWFWAVTVT